MNTALIAVALRWLATLWVLAYAVYVTLGDGSRLSSVEGMLRCLATLLVPAALAFGLSWVLSRNLVESRQSRKPSPR
jgi:hypothetical protein